MEGSIAGLRVAWSPDLGYAAIDSEVREIAAAAAQRFGELGCHVEEAHPEVQDPWDFVNLIWASAFAGIYLHNLNEVRDLIDPGLLAVMEQGQRFSAAELASAYTQRNDYYHNWRVFMQSYDLMLTPTLPVTAFTAGDDHPAQIDGRPDHLSGLDCLYLSVRHHRTARGDSTLRLRQQPPAGWPAHRRALARRYHRASRVRCL